MQPPFFDDKSTQVGASNHRRYLFGALALLASEARWLVFSCAEPRTSREVLFTKRFFLEELVGWEPFSFPFGFTLLLRIVFDSALFSSRALTFSCPLYANSNVYGSFALCSPEGAAPEQDLQVVFHDKGRNASHEFSVRESGLPFFSLCSLQARSFEQHLECTATATTVTALALEADDKNQRPRILSSGFSSSRSSVHPITS